MIVRRETPMATKLDNTRRIIKFGWLRIKGEISQEELERRVKEALRLEQQMSLGIGAATEGPKA